MSSFGTGSTNTSGSSIVLTAFTGTDGNNAGTDGLVPGPSTQQFGYILGAGGDWTLDIKGNIPLNESSDRIATTEFVQDVVGNAVLGGNAQLSQLTDVTIAGLADDQFLQYNVGSGKWENATLTLSLISDINLNGLVDGNSLVYDANAQEWVPGVGGGGGANDLDGLTDVTLDGNETTDHFLVHNGAGQFVNRVIDTSDLSDSANIVLLNANQTFTGDVRADTQVQADNSTLLATTAFVQQEITALNLGTASQNNTNDFLSSNSSVDDLNNVTLDGNETTDHFLVHNGAGQFVNRLIDSSDLSDSANIVLLNANQTFTGDVRADTQVANDSSTLLATTAFVQQEITNASIADLSDVNTLANIQDGNVLAWVANNNRFEFTAPAQTYTDENAQDAVNDMLNNNGAVHTNISFTYDDNANNMAVAVSLASTDLTDSNDLARLNSPSLTGVPLAPTANQGTNTTQIATTAYVQTEITTLNLGTASQNDTGDFLASNSSIDDLNDVNLGGALVNGKVLKVVGGVLTQADDVGKTDEEIQDVVGPMLDHNNHSTGISFAYDDNNNRIDSTLTQNLQDLSALNVGDGNFIVGDGNNFVVESGAVARTSLGLTIGTDVQAQSAILQDISDLDPISANKFLYTTAQNDFTTADITAVGLALLDDATVQDQRNTLGLGTASTSDTGDFLASNSSIDDLNDVTLGVLAQNNVLKYTANNVFENVALATSDLSDNSNIDKLDGNQTITGDKVFEGNVELDVDGNGTYTVKTPALQADNKEIANTEWVRDVVAQVGNVGALDDLNDVTLDGNETTDHFLVHNGAGQFVNRTIDSTDLSNSANIVLLDANQTFTGDVRADTQVNGDNTTLLSTTAFVQQEITALNLGTASQNATGDFLASNSSLDDLNDVTLGVLAQNNVLKYTANNVFENVALSSSDLSDSANLITVSSSIGDLSDVDTTNKADGKILKFNAQGNLVVADDDNAPKTDEEIEDLVGTQFNHANHSTGISFSYVDDGGANDGEIRATLTQNLQDLSALNVADGNFIVGDGNNFVVESGADVRTSLGLTIGTNVQAYSAILQDISNLDPISANKFLYTTAQNDFASADITAVGLALLDDATVQDQRNTLGLGTASTSDTGDFLASNSSLDDLNNVTLDGNETTRHILVHNGAGQFVNRVIEVADLSDNNTIVLTSGNQTITDQKDFTGGTLLASTQLASDSSTKVATTAFVQQEISGTELNELNDITIANPSNRQSLIYNNGTWINATLSSSDLSDTANIALLDANQNFTGNIDFQGDTTADTQNASDNSTKVATTAYVDTQIDTDIANTSVGGLSNVTLGGVALSEGQVLRVSNDNSTFVNAQLSYNDLSNTPTLGTSASKDAGTGADEVLLLTQATTLPALDGSNLTALGSIDLLSNVDITTNAPQNNQVLLWDGNNFVPGDRTGYADEDARDAVGTALNGGTHTGATTITFTNNDNADTIDLTLEIESANLTDVSSDAPTNTQVLRFTTEAGDNQNKYVPTTLGTASDVNTGVDSGNVPVISDHYLVNGTNEKGDLLIYGRYVEVIDYGSVTDAFNANTHFAIDFGSITDSVIYVSEDYGVLVC